MSARVLIVDDIATNIKVLEAKLTHEYFSVVTATSGQQAIDICEQGACDLVLLDVMMPEMDGFETCQLLKGNPKTQHIPVIMLTALDSPSDRARGLEAGADDFLTKPADDMQLFARVRSLVRLKTLTDELRERAMSGQSIGLEETFSQSFNMHPRDGKILLVDNNPRSAERLQQFISRDHNLRIITDPNDALYAISEGSYELVIVSMSMEGENDPLRLCSQIRTLEKTRTLPILLVADEDNKSKVVKALDLGVNDYIMRPVERTELEARVRTQIRRHRYAEELREDLNTAMALVITDDLTGLYNRRYFERHLSLLIEKARSTSTHLSLMMMDIDLFKVVNDRFGHGAGDQVLKEFSRRLQSNIRGMDFACRFGGEEFVIMLPDTDINFAKMSAERLCRSIAEVGFDVGIGEKIKVTASIGVASLENLTDTPETLLRRADIALYKAKDMGRNQVVIDAA